MDLGLLERGHIGFPWDNQWQGNDGLLLPMARNGKMVKLYGDAYVEYCLKIYKSKFPKYTSPTVFRMDSVSALTMWKHFRNGDPFLGYQLFHSN